jgi:pimeloyl-ACP methyl ester carboxylesterase
MHVTRPVPTARVVVGVALVASLAFAGCSGADDRGGSPPGSTADGPLPRPVEVRQEPEAASFADPFFEPLPGARADFGRIGGSEYQIEVPDRWNGKLVLWMHGFDEFAPELSVSAPDMRTSLVHQGYAWGASSFSSTSWIPGRAADETAALWDHFANTHGRPDRTYVMGASMGGAASYVAAERYPERFDGVLSLCGSAGATPALTDNVNLFVAAAYAAGVTQAELDASADIASLIDDRIRPALREPARRDRFERIVVDLTGGPRPFDVEGFRMEEDTDWRRIALVVGAGLVPPRDTPYRLGPSSDVPDDDFNRAAVRPHTNDDLLREFLAGNELTGRVRVPLLALHTTGDGQVPIEQARIHQRLVDDTGAGDLLVQRVLRDAGHCGFSTVEIAASFYALVGWVEHHDRPAGNDVLTDDLASPQPSFELHPRPGTPEAREVPGADDRVTIHGRATLDGTPLDARWLGVYVVEDGLMAPCQHDLVPVTSGDFEVTAMADREASGCGTQGADLVFWTYADDQQLQATEAVRWPGDGTSADVDVRFSTTDPQGRAPVVGTFVGEALGADGDYVPPGTRVEAYVGDARCGITSTRRTGSFSGYTLAVSGPDARPGCERDATLSFRIDGETAAQTATNDPGTHTSPFDLTMQRVGRGRDPLRLPRSGSAVATSSDGER